MFDRLRRSGPVGRLENSVHAHGLDHVVLTDDVERWLRWMARGLSVVVLAGAAYALVQFGAPRSHEYVAWEETASIVALAVAGGGLVLAFIWEPVGAATALISGVFVGALAAYEFSLLIALGVVTVIVCHEIVLFIMGGLFVLETVSVILQVASFKLKGKRVFAMAPIHHHFELRQWSETQVTVRFWILSIIFALLALSSLKLR